MGQNIGLAVTLAIVGSFCFALAAKVQHSAVRVQVDDNPSERRLNFRQLWILLHDVNWWLGMLLMTTSLICQLVALWKAPVTVVQPIALLAFPWSVVLTWKSIGAHPRLVIASTALTVAATAVFVVIVALNVTPDQGDINLRGVALGAFVVYLWAASFALLGSHGRRAWRCLFWSSGAALFYGLEAALEKALLLYAVGREWWLTAVFWIIVPALIIGSALAGAMGQQGYATGSAKVVVASMTVTSPVVAIVFGVVVLGEGSGLSPAAIAGLIMLGCVAIGGVVWLAMLSQRKPASVEAPS